MIPVHDIEAAPFFGEVAVRVTFGDDERGLAHMSPDDAMRISKQMAKAAKSAGYKAPKKGAAGA